MLELKSDHPNITNSHNCIAVIYEQKSDYTHALESYEKELGNHIRPSFAICKFFSRNFETVTSLSTS